MYSYCKISYCGIEKMAAESKRRPRRRGDIDGLRGVACTAVVLNHLDHRYMEGGFVGVDIFYVISGFVVTLSVISHAKGERLSLRQLAPTFYARRVRRLMPLSVTVVLATALLTSVAVPATETGPLIIFYDTGLSALIGWANNFFVAREFSGVVCARINNLHPARCRSFSVSCDLTPLLLAVLWLFSHVRGALARVRRAAGTGVPAGQAPPGTRTRITGHSQSRSSSILSSRVRPCCGRTARGWPSGWGCSSRWRP
jgi:peptidoglycan/LPS O-acetylase OafA/YrhL